MNSRHAKQKITDIRNGMQRLLLEIEAIAKRREPRFEPKAHHVTATECEKSKVGFCIVHLHYASGGRIRQGKCIYCGEE